MLKKRLASRMMRVHFVSMIYKKYQTRRRAITFFKQKPPYHLHLGCGNIRAEGYCNVDIAATEVTDVIDDVSLLKRFPDRSASEIYACHVLEHFSHDDIPRILRRWYDVLQPGGLLRLSVPDIDRIVKIYSDNWQHFQTPGNSPWIGLIYGGQSSQYDFHKTGFNFCWLKYILENCGFTDCQEYQHYPHFIEGLVDGSLAKEPFGVYLSLNIMATRPSNS